ncbi:acetamidase/formamidase family protein [Paenibacillus sp. JX-17]|uniref:Acetamidase/formamidase family protein n=1 Tax=Paenibacillus lacisoli TaxID=3064525 RepID=A0ABT9CL24_9BACL|nr:acetamidase/formamidase family protein [Paenibacillus sp. JX-17]MDO7908622.1 acetamidase/formamidase family protein [Paenibacillus sp. JX-17]
MTNGLKVEKEHFIYAFDKNTEPAVQVSPGSRLVIETYDCFQNQIQHADTTYSTIDWNRINPATGPVYVESAEPGDILKVTIEQIDLGPQGVMATGPQLGIMGHRLNEFEVKIIPVQNGKALFNDKLQLDLNPMIGVIGVAPEQEPVSCGTPGSHGGNMDTTLVTTGAVLYFPVYQPGALFALGDLHAAMGDGEVGVSGIEIPAEVTVTLDVIKGQSIPYPFLENKDGLAVLVSKETLDEAAKSAVEIMADTLLPHTDLSLGELTMLFSAVGQSQISQIVDPLMTARFFVPRQVLDAYNIQLFNGSLAE